MFKPLSLFIGLRYTRAKRRNHFISFIALASILGIALGVAVLITVLSVMNGFDQQIRNRFFALAPQVTVLTSQDIADQFDSLRTQALGVEGVTGAAPYISGKGMLVKQDQVNGLEVVGIDPRQEPSVSELDRNIVQGKLSSLKPGAFNIIIGRSLADAMNLQLGDKVLIFTPQTIVTLVGVLPRTKRFTVSGIFHASDGFGFDTSVAYINIKDAGKLFPEGVGTSGLHIRLHDIYSAASVSLALQRMLPDDYSVTNWMLQFGAFFQALAMEKTMLFIILVLIIAVAAFNLVSTLVMVVNDKRADIAILRTLGATPGMIMRTILVTGSLIGLFGTALGVVGGLLLAHNVTALAELIQNALGVRLITASIYFVDYLPSLIDPWDVIAISLIAFLLCLLATLYPAWMAFRTQPAEALRYE